MPTRALDGHGSAFANRYPHPHPTPPPTPISIVPRTSDMSDSERAPTHDRPSSVSSTTTPVEPVEVRTRGESLPPKENERETLSRRLFSRTKDEHLLGSWHPTLILENSGSVARDHLASERTFLAYMRTSLTIASTGVALVQLFTISAETTNKHLEKFSRPLGAVIIVIGLGVLFLGLVRYFTIQNALVGGNYPVARVSTILLSVVMAAVTVAVFGIIVGVQ